MSTEETKENKEKRRWLDETGKRLLREMRPIRGWILLCAVFCLFQMTAEDPPVRPAQL